MSMRVEELVKEFVALVGKGRLSGEGERRFGELVGWFRGLGYTSEDIVKLVGGKRSASSIRRFSAVVDEGLREESGA